jgi:hypothetical protein
MDETKQRGEIDALLREVATQRDKLLGRVPTLSPARRAVLNDFLPGDHPVEAALRQLASNRDQLLKRPAAIPASAESILRRQLMASNRVMNTPGWLRFFRSPLNAALTVCVLIAGAILCFSLLGTALRRTAQNHRHPSKTDAGSIESNTISDRSQMARAELFARKALARPFNLNTNEPASLQASFFANSGISFAEGNVGPLGLRLDLPVRVILTEDVLARTP